MISIVGHYPWSLLSTYLTCRRLSFDMFMHGSHFILSKKVADRRCIPGFAIKSRNRVETRERWKMASSFGQSGESSESQELTDSSIAVSATSVDSLKSSAA